MTTENNQMDTTGAEANKPENQQNAGTPNSILEQRLADINARKQSEPQPDEAAPKEEQPEMKPNLTSEKEADEVEAITEAFAEANTDVRDTETPEEAAMQEVTAPEQQAASAEQDPVKEYAPEPDAGKELEAATPDLLDKPTPAAATGAATQHHEEEEEEEEETVDYSLLSLDELRQQLQTVLKGSDAMKQNRVINELHRHYDQKFQAERYEALERFKQEGGTEDDFAYSTSKEHQDLEKLLSAYREARHQQRQNVEEQRQRNLERKEQLLTQLRQLVESAETKNSSDEVKKLQAEWKSIGPVPAGEAQEQWDSYHALLDIFYNNRSMFFEMKELDRKRNLDAKIHLVERAEALKEEQSINKALQELRHLHEEWKNIGPVPNDQRDPIWERFIQASEQVHERRRAYHGERNQRELENLTKKRALLERLQEYTDFKTERINEWRDKTDEIQKLKEEWDAAGLVPKEHAEEVNKNFWGNYKAFFQHKNQFFKALDEQKMQNLRLKTELCEEAESLKDSTDWNSTKEKLIQLQKKWKTIGRVPDKHSDKIWQRFRAACNEFFDRKQSSEQSKSAELEKLSAEKAELCDRIAEKLAIPTTVGSMLEYEAFVTEWRALDTDKRRSSPKVEEKFMALIEKYLERVPALSLQERNDLLVKLQVERIKHSPDAGQKLQQREQHIRREITHLQNDIQTLRTNIEFFGRSKNADKLRQEYEGKIADAQKRIEQLQHQLQAFRG
ncbi:DUF349 domain-containing protein [Pontibacter diazotrophicus]|uniref:DUF349 domain-containing protein n=1 Tax=Pontibacter diazotrophicus TaxID=1400979 RepID=A0A3D8LGF4_9BACT|nr:DUF349 domain-containing protein [Pontibacter diazotrophicus]RDV16304.1 DUF349 domain-containing protein [Pontibacter diazotrophicus]